MTSIRVLFVTAVLTVLKGQNIIPSNDHCVPNLNNCQKGDLIDESVADCCYVPWFFDIGTCDAIGDGLWDRTVNIAKEDRCQASACDGQYQFTCGQHGTNSRCVCDDKVAYDIGGNRCRCQYWPTEPPHTVAPHTEPITVTTNMAPTTDFKTSTNPESKPTTHPPPNDLNIYVIVAVVIGAFLLVMILIITVVVCVTTKCCRRCRQCGYTSL